MDNMKRGVIWDALRTMFERRTFGELENIKAEAVGKLMLIHDLDQAKEALAALDKGLSAEVVQEYFGNPTASSVAKAPEQAE